MHPFDGDGARGVAALAQQVRRIRRQRDALREALEVDVLKAAHDAAEEARRDADAQLAVRVRGRPVPSSPLPLPPNTTSMQQ